MNSIAVIAEYNPFHNGHKYMIQNLRGTFGSDAVIAVIMSGSFVQRGEPALFDKWTRAAWALNAGADCVIELPALCALSSAEAFGTGAVRLAGKLGCTHLSCGVEQGTARDFYILAQAALTLADQTVVDDRGRTYGQYLTDQISRKVPPKISALLAHPNALLALEYVKGILRYAPGMQFVPVSRTVRHDTLQTAGSFASASALRRMITSGDGAGALRPYVPEAVYGDIRDLLSQGRYTDYRRYEDLLLYCGRTLTPHTLQSLPAFSEGLENRWYRCLTQAASWPQALSLLKTRRYSCSRLKRMGAYTVLAIPRQDMAALRQAGPPYGRLLGLSPQGAAFIRQAKAFLPIITHPGKSQGTLAAWEKTVLAHDIKSTDIQSLCFHSPACRKGLLDYYRAPVITGVAGTAEKQR